MVPWNDIDALFIGGDDRWKMGPIAMGMVESALNKGKWTHIGRVNSWKRLNQAAAYGVDSVDGTMLAFGPDVNLKKLRTWLDQLEKKPHLFHQEHRFTRNPITNFAGAKSSQPGVRGNIYLVDKDPDDYERLVDRLNQTLHPDNFAANNKILEDAFVYGITFVSSRRSISKYNGGKEQMLETRTAIAQDVVSQIAYTKKPQELIARTERFGNEGFDLLAYAFGLFRRGKEESIAEDIIDRAQVINELQDCGDDPDELVNLFSETELHSLCETLGMSKDAPKYTLARTLIAERNRIYFVITGDLSDDFISQQTTA
jgi:hypothetical protein